LSALENLPDTEGLQVVDDDDDEEWSTLPSSSSEYSSDMCETGGEVDLIEANLAAENCGSLDLVDEDEVLVVVVVVDGVDDGAPKRVCMLSAMPLGSCPREKTPIVGA
jgi:hypothetical protein